MKDCVVKPVCALVIDSMETVISKTAGAAMPKLGLKLCGLCVGVG